MFFRNTGRVSWELITPDGGCGKADFLRILIAAGDTSYLASKFQNNRTYGYGGNSYSRNPHIIYNSVGPKHCIAAHLIWSRANYSNSVDAPAFRPFSTARFRFFLNTAAVEFLETAPFSTSNRHAPEICSSAPDATHPLNDDFTQLFYLIC